MNTKLYVLTGFLGSGKTTVLKEIIRNLKGKKIGVVQNEFGKLSIDGDILRDSDIEMVEITRGSIFCTCLQLTFVKTLAEMAEKDFDYLFVEGSGLGDPSNLEEILEAVKILSNKSYDFCGVICAADAYNFTEQLKDLETVERQLKHCNLCLITKADLIDEKAYEQLLKKIREINPVCKIENALFGKVETDIFKEDLSLFKWAENEDTTNIPETKPKTLFMEIYEEAEEEALRNFLEEIAPFAYRIKGFVKVEGKGLCKVDLAGKKVDIVPEEREFNSELVFISKIGPQIIRSIMDIWGKTVNREMKLKN